MASMSERTSLFESLSSPRSSEQWKQALEGVKLLYIRRQYKQCAARAAETLRNANQKIHPVHKTYLHFYSAISYEGMGRAAHQYSSTKVTLLQTALDCFITCSAVFPSLIPVREDEDDENGLEDWTPLSDTESTPAVNMLENSSSISSFVTVIRDIIDKNIDSLADDPFVSDPELDNRDSNFPPTPSVGPGYQFGKTLLMPPPLKVRKSQEALNPAELKPSANVNQKHGESKQASSNPVPHPPGRARRPPPLPIRINPPETTHIDTSKPHAPIPLKDHPQSTALIASCVPVPVPVPVTPTPTPPRGAITRYNNHLRFLRAQITSTIASLRTLIAEVTELQESRRAAKNFRRSSSFWTFSPVKSPARGGQVEEEHVSNKSGEQGSGLVKWSMTETKEQRIARLRADGWRSVGLRAPGSRWKGSQYYKRYCGAVLDELYLEG